MNSRAIALKCLEEIFLKDGYINLVLKNECKGLALQDEAFVRYIVMETCRNYRYVRYQWECYVNKLPSRKTCLILDMSITQLFLMDKVPEYAIVSEAQNLAKYDRKFVKAILEKVIKNGKKDLSDTDEDLSIRYSVPLWLFKMMKSHYKENYMHIFETMQMNAKVYGRVNTLVCSKEDLDVDYLDDCAFIVPKDYLKNGYLEKGYFVVQDLASQMVAKVLDPKENEHILDVCGAPGTKTSHIAMLMHNTGHIDTVDIYEHRIALLNEAINRVHMTNCTGHVMDAREMTKHFSEEYDRILVDAPCSGLGVMRRKCDIRWHVTPQSLDEIVELQHEILNEACKLLKINGTLVYSTCTLNRKENEKQIERFLKEHDDFKLIIQRTIMPYDMDCDGFYHAKLIKVK